MTNRLIILLNDYLRGAKINKYIIQHHITAVLTINNKNGSYLENVCFTEYSKTRDDQGSKTKVGLRNV